MKQQEIITDLKQKLNKKPEVYQKMAPDTPMTTSKNNNNTDGNDDNKLCDAEKEELFIAYYDHDALTRTTVVSVLGENAVRTAEENARGAEEMMNGDLSRFLADNENDDANGDSERTNEMNTPTVEELAEVCNVDEEWMQLTATATAELTREDGSDTDDDSGSDKDYEWSPPTKQELAEVGDETSVAIALESCRVADNDNTNGDNGDTDE